MGIFGRKRSSPDAGTETYVAVPQAELEQWIDNLTDEVEALYPGNPTPAFDSSLRRAAAYVNMPPTKDVTQEEGDIAASIALTGYLFREREREVLRDWDASGTLEVLARSLEENPQWETWPQAAAGTAATFAFSDSPERDRPAMIGAMNVGPEGHRLAATSFVLGMAPPPDEQGSFGNDHYLRAWRFGYFLRCFEAACEQKAMTDVMELGRQQVEGQTD